MKREDGKIYAIRPANQSTGAQRLINVPFNSSASAPLRTIMLNNNNNNNNSIINMNNQGNVPRRVVTPRSAAPRSSFTSTGFTSHNGQLMTVKSEPFRNTGE